MRRNHEVWRRAGRLTAVWIVGVVCAVAWVLTTTAARAETAPPDANAGAEAIETEVSPSSPRAALASFIEKAGSSFAFPTRTVHLVPAPSPAPAVA